MELRRGQGNEHRAYPWGDEAPSQDLAVIRLRLHDDGAHSDPVRRVGNPRGRRESGDKPIWRGSLFEWVLDYHADLTRTCPNCATLTDGGFGRGSRGGAFSHTEETLSPTYRIGELPERTLSFYGFRCAPGRVGGETASWLQPCSLDISAQSRSTAARRLETVASSTAPSRLWASTGFHSR